MTRCVRNIDFWYDMYELAVLYCDYHGGTVQGMPVNFCTNDGINYDPNGKKLYAWLRRQLERRDISDEEKKLLHRIGYPSFKKYYTWEEMYEFAKNYYEELGNLLVPTDFTTSNGYIYEPNGSIKLGQWIINCRNSFKDDADKRAKLDSIGMVWNIKKNTYAIKILCNRLGIDYFKNGEVLQEMSYLSFKVKIAYLLHLFSKGYSGIDLVDEDGNLHEIFSMLNSKMKLKYNNGLEELIIMYGQSVEDELCELYRLLKIKKSNYSIGDVTRKKN